MEQANINQSRQSVSEYIRESSMALTIIYTVGHIIIAMTCNLVITGASLNLAAFDAIIEPVINGVWFYLLHKTVRHLTTSATNEREYGYGH